MRSKEYFRNLVTFATFSTSEAEYIIHKYSVYMQYAKCCYRQLLLGDSKYAWHWVVFVNIIIISGYYTVKNGTITSCL